MSDGKAYVFGDVIRVDPYLITSVPQPDDRRWLVIAFDDRQKWTVQYLGPTAWNGMAGVIEHWGSLHGFVRVEDEDDALAARDDLIDAGLGTGYFGEME